MGYQSLYELFPAIAERETRNIIIGEQTEYALPPATYTFIEQFCNDRGCDCRRVFFYVKSSLREGPEAVIAYGWESEDYYIEWMGDDDPLSIEQLKGPMLNLASPRTYLSNELVTFFIDVLLNDKEYIERVKRHYRLFRGKIDGKPTLKIPSNNRKK